MSRQVILLFVILLINCRPERDNPLDPESSLYTPPELVIDWKNSSVKQDETIYADSIKISLGSNLNSLMEFRFKFKDTWSQWQNDSLISIDNIDDGTYTISIQKRYKHGTDIDEDSLTFTIQALAQSAVYLFPKKIETALKLCTLKVFTKGIASNCYVAHFALKKDCISSFTLSGTADNRSTLVSGNTVDIIAFSENVAIKGNDEIGSIVLFTDSFSTNEQITFNSELFDSTRTLYKVQEVRGSLIIKK